MPVEIPSPIRFENDTTHRSYDPVFANRFWRILAQIDDVLTRDAVRLHRQSAARRIFSGAASIWRVTRFSGRPAPPREGPAFMREAYSYEVISHGFWPGSAPVLEPAFYAYSVPEPARIQRSQSGARRRRPTTVIWVSSSCRMNP